MATTSRIPVLGGPSRYCHHHHHHSSSSQLISAKDIGRTVSLLGTKKNGTLRFVGRVHFSNGLWCGVELKDKQTANRTNGVFRGVRYFSTTSDMCAVMVPHTKVKILSPLNGTDGDKAITNSTLKTVHKAQNVQKSSVEEDALNVTLIQIADDDKFEENKRDSLEMEESLGILTPEEMVDGMSTLLDDDFRNTASKDLPSPTLGTDCSLGIIDEQMLDLPLDSNRDPFDMQNKTPSPDELPLDPTPIIVRSNPIVTKSQSSSFIASITSVTSLDNGYQGDGEMSRPGSRGPADSSPIGRRLLIRPPPLRRPTTAAVDALTDSDFYTESDHDENPQRGDRRARIIDGTLYGVDTAAATDIYINNREPMYSSGVFTDIDSTNTTRTEDFLPISTSVSPSDDNSSSKTLAAAICAIEPNQEDNCSDKMSSISSSTISCTQNNPNKRAAAPSPVASTTSSTNSPKYSCKKDTSNPAATTNTNHTNSNKKNSNSASINQKKYKIPKRDTTPVHQQELLLSRTVINNCKKPLASTTHRWDSIMNKIANGNTDQTKKKVNLKDIKSKVFCKTTATTTSSPHTTDLLHTDEDLQYKRNTISKSEFVSPQKSANCKTRRTRPRISSVKILQTNTPNDVINTSSSDLNTSGFTPIKANATKKRNSGIQVTQVLTTGKIPNRISNNNIQVQQQNSITTEKTNNKATTPLSKSKKLTTPPAKDNGNKHQKKTSPAIIAGKAMGAKNKKNRFSATSNVEYFSREVDTSKVKIKSCIWSTSLRGSRRYSKDSGKAVGKGGRTSPEVRPPSQPKIQVPTKSTPKITEALAILVQHLVFNVEAYQVPNLRREMLKMRSETDKIKDTFQHLEANLEEERTKQSQIIEELRCHYENEMRDQQNHNDTKLNTLTREFQKLEKIHKDTLEILREENDAVREEIDDKNAIIARLEAELVAVQQESDMKIFTFTEQLHIANERNNNYKDELTDLIKELGDLKTMKSKEDRSASDFCCSSSNNNCNISDSYSSLREVESLRAVLELKQDEVSELRRTLADLEQKNELYAKSEMKAAVLNARCEDLQLQLERKSEYEMSLIADNKKLNDSLKDELNKKQRLVQYNEELQWKLRQNKEILTKILAQNESNLFNNNNNNNMSYNCYGNISTKSIDGQFCRTLSFRETSSSLINNSTNNTRVTSKSASYAEPIKVKGIVEKSDSVSYVLDLDDVPDVVASRIVRRSFRQKSPLTTKRRVPSAQTNNTHNSKNDKNSKQNPLSLSASANAIVVSSTTTTTTNNNNKLTNNNNKSTHFMNKRARSFSMRNSGNISTLSGPKKTDCYLWTSTPTKRQTQNEDISVVDLDDVALKLPDLPVNTETILPSPDHHRLKNGNMYSDTNSDDYDDEDDDEDSNSSSTSSSIQL